MFQYSNQVNHVYDRLGFRNHVHLNSVGSSHHCHKQILNFEFSSTPFFTARKNLIQTSCHPSFSRLTMQPFKETKFPVRISFILLFSIDSSKICSYNYIISHLFSIKRNSSVEEKPYFFFLIHFLKSLREMASSSNNQVSAITTKMQNSTSRDLCARQMRRTLGSKQTIIVEASSEWKNTLIGKLFSKDASDTDDVRKTTISLWKRYKVKEVRGVDRNIFVFKFHTEDTMNTILKKGPWNVLKCLLNLKIYDPAISVQNQKFTHQEWNIQFQHLLLEHHSPTVVNDAINELGDKIWLVPENYRPGAGGGITARVKIDLSKPLHIGRWWNTAAGGVAWVCYHWERQSHTLCKNFFCF